MPIINQGHQMVDQPRQGRRRSAQEAVDPHLDHALQHRHQIHGSSLTSYH
ncbi:MAG: hypothetical protein L0H96_08485 [Humibacillus sp.]|nr:hypothetical protein [Humibacillus sp.]MDN5776932.1 hypothetical protein [Humibacillus sp.]